MIHILSILLCAASAIRAPLSEAKAEKEKSPSFFEKNQLHRFGMEMMDVKKFAELALALKREQAKV